MNFQRAVELLRINSKSSGKDWSINFEVACRTSRNKGDEFTVTIWDGEENHEFDSILPAIEYLKSRQRTVEELINEVGDLSL